MTRTSLLSGAALVLGALGFGAPAFAVTPHSLGDTAGLVVTVADVENEAVWQDLRPELAPPPAAVERGELERHEGAAVQPFGFESSGGNIENQELWHDLETGVTPPPGD